MKITNKEQVTEFKLVTTGYKCDCCGKVENSTQFPIRWHILECHHNDWGNDSRESLEVFDVCSIECYKKTFKEVVDSYHDIVSGEVDGFSIQFARELAKTF